MKKQITIYILIFLSGFVFYRILRTTYVSILLKYKDTKLQNTSSNASQNDIRRKILEANFNEELISHDTLLYPPISSLEKLYQRIENMAKFKGLLPEAYKAIKIIECKKFDNKIAVIYEINQIKDTAYAYCKIAENANEKGFMIIPGSGINQSSAMIRYSSTTINYQSDLDDLLNSYGDVYIQIKPNEDILAIHNGSFKISVLSYVNYLLNIGGSYSEYYLIQSLALMKYIKSIHSETGIFGLSQGGRAALYNALQSKPNFAVIASGFSVLSDFPTVSGHNQLIINNLLNYYDSEKLKTKICDNLTQYLFMYGQYDDGFYIIEHQEGLTKEFFKACSNIKVESHSLGHVYNIKSIGEFINK